ncbi:MAG: glycine cleavage system aminomethyltransferase GcvT [Gammaproteobacteria bacterium]|nr:MAG: glycine cleavage system aminomethyltransferase GcvT [Gammaproteobacteria bacterium]
MTERTPLHAEHVADGAKMVDFHGWDMPLHYGSQVEEHHAVRRGAGMFDVSHMTVVDVTGEGATAWLRWLLANDVGKLKAAPGRALYTAMLDSEGGILDDLIVYRRDGGWRLVVNSATRQDDLAWLETQRRKGVTVTERPELAMIAVQGPAALERSAAWLGSAAEAVAGLKPFGFVEDGDRFIARTGYTGEDGFEVILPGDGAAAAWQALRDADIAAAGLGARDTLRLEAGLNLYGQDMDRSVTPLESNLAWSVAFKPPERDFIGRAALERQREEGVPRVLVGLKLQARGVLRRGQRVLYDGQPVGELTSGAFSPTLGVGIGLARIDAGIETQELEVDIRGKSLPVARLKPPFVKRGEAA